MSLETRGVVVEVVVGAEEKREKTKRTKEENQERDKRVREKKK